MTADDGRAFERILIIMFENQYRSYVLQNPYMRKLARQGIELTNCFGVMHPSQTNYISSIAGELCNVTSDERPPPLPQRTIVDLLEEAPGELTWKAYMQSYVAQATPWRQGFTPEDAYPYVIKHNPFSSFTRILEDEARWARVQDEAAFWQDVAGGSLPHFAWFTPNMWNDGHYLDGTHEAPDERAPALVDQLAAWLERFFGALRFPGPDSLLPAGTLVVVTFDEADFEADAEKGKKSAYDGPNQIYCVLLGQGIAPGVEDQGANHYSLLRTVEENFRLGSLGKNDAGANWFQFLWQRRWRWGPPVETPIQGTASLATAELDQLMMIVYARSDGALCSRTTDGESTSAEQALPVTGGGPLALARGGPGLLLAFQDGGGRLCSLDFTLASGWSRDPVVLSEAAVHRVAACSCNGGGEVMVAYVDAEGEIWSRRRDGRDWGAAQAVGQKTDGDIALAALGAGLLLVFHAPGSADLKVVTYNTADFNVVTVAPYKYGGPWDDTVKDAWSPSAFDLTHFGAAPSPVTPVEPEPAAITYAGGSPLAMAEHEGVVHLVHPGADSPLLLSETFSVSGAMTPKCPVSYLASDGKTTSNGFGTMAEAGWDRQRPISTATLAPGGALALGRLNGALALLHQSEDSACVALRLGRYCAGA